MRAHCSRLNRTSYAAASAYASSGKAARRALHAAAPAPDHRQRGGAPPGLGVPAAQHLGCTPGEGLRPGALELAAAIRSASAVPDGARARAIGRCLHGLAVKAGRVASSAAVAKAVMDMYGRSGGLADARLVFDEIALPDAVCWNTMAMAYARGGRYREAARVMYRMKAAGMNPSEEMTDAVRLACFR